MIYLKLFLTFLQIGAVSFGGGYGMLSLIREKCIEATWLSEEQFLNFVAVSESTPGPISVNMATFIGASQGGFLGSLFATLGLVLPSFIIILLIIAIIKNFIKHKAVQSVLSAIKPVVVGLIIATALTLLLSTVFNITTISQGYDADYYAVIILAVIFLGASIYKKFLKKAPSPILLIVFSAVMGVILY